MWRGPSLSPTCNIGFFHRDPVSAQAGPFFGSLRTRAQQPHLSPASAASPYSPRCIQSCRGGGGEGRGEPRSTLFLFPSSSNSSTFPRLALLSTVSWEKPKNTVSQAISSGKKFWDWEESQPVHPGLTPQVLLWLLDCSIFLTPADPASQQPEL